MKKNGEVYFAHSKRDYGTAREAQALRFLRRKFPKVCDPNKDLGELGGIMPYLKKVERSRLVVVMEHQGHIGRGAYEEAFCARVRGIPVLCLRRLRSRWVLLDVKYLKIVDNGDWAIRYGKLIV